MAFATIALSKKSDKITLKRVNYTFPLSLSKNDQFTQKPKSEFPTLQKSYDTVPLVDEGNQSIQLVRR